MLIASAEPLPLGVDDGARLRFGEEPFERGRGRRLLYRDERPIFELSYWCGTCRFLFRRLAGSNDTVSLAELEATLAEGLDDIDRDVVARFAALLPAGEYLPLLLEVRPRLVRPVEPGDYFAEEQVATWGIEGFWGLPEHPHTPYYRTFETAVDAGAHLFEFLVPMVPPNWNLRDRVEQYRARLRGSSRPTAVAVSTLDVCEPAVDTDNRDYHAHWGLSHFLLDGHHKVEAAATAGRPLRLLSLLSVDASLAERDEVLRVPELRRRAPGARVS